MNYELYKSLVKLNNDINNRVLETDFKAKSLVELISLVGFTIDDKVKGLDPQIK